MACTRLAHANPGGEGMDRSWVRSAAYLVTIVFVGLGLLGIAGRAGEHPSARPETAVAPVMYPLYRLMPKPKVTGFYQGPQSYAAFVRTASTLSTVSPLWYSISPTGTIASDSSDPNVTTVALRKTVGVMPLVTNVGSHMLLNPGSRAQAVRSLDSIGRKHRYAGVIMDFELLPPAARPGLTSVVKELAMRLHHSGKKLGVTVFPKVGVVGTLPNAYDYRELGKYADLVEIMTYDAHYSGGPPGPVAPYPWVNANLIHALRYIPRGHLALGVALYGYDWPTKSAPSKAATVTMAQAVSTAKAHGVTIRFDKVSGEGTYHYTDSSGTVHTVWFETPTSIAEKAALARRSEIGGVAVWALGQETQASWKTFLAALRSGRNPPQPKTA